MTLTQSFTESGSGIHLGGEAGIIDMTIASRDTASITWSRAKFKIEAFNSLEEEFPLIVGFFTTRGPL
jgi:hypothetical protein